MRGDAASAFAGSGQAAGRAVCCNVPEEVEPYSLSLPGHIVIALAAVISETDDNAKIYSHSVEARPTKNSSFSRVPETDAHVSTWRAIMNNGGTTDDHSPHSLCA